MLRGTPTRDHLALHSALRATSDISQLINLLELGERPCTSASGSCFAIAIENLNWSKVKLLLDHTPKGVNISTKSKRVTALMKFGHVPDATQYLLSIGADVNAKDWRGHCVLSHVIRHKDTNLAAVRMLIDAGANINARGVKNLSILNQFLQHHKKFDVQIFTMLLTAGAEVDDATLRNIILQNQVNLEIVKALTEAPSDVNVQNLNKNKILMRAAKNRKLDIVKLMIKSGADVNFQEVDSKFSALMFAVESQDVEMIKSLIKAGADVNLQDKNGCSVLMHAIQCKAKNVVCVANMLLKKQADLRMKDRVGYNALMYAVESQNFKMIKSLIKAGADVNLQDKNGCSMLMHAIQCKKENVVRVVNMLLEKQADLCVKDRYRNNALMLAVQHPEHALQLVEAIIKSGAPINDRNNDGESALILAVRRPKMNPQVVKILIKARAAVHVRNKAGDSPLMLALMNSDVTLEVVRMFTSAGALVLAENDERQTALSAAIGSCKWKVNEKMLLILKHLLQLPELKDVVYAPHANHPQQVLLKTLRNETNFLDRPMFEIFKLIVNSQFKNTTYLESSSIYASSLFQNDNNLLGAVALLLKDYIHPDYVFVLKEYVKMLLDAGFNMREGVSPLTVFLRNLINGRLGDVQITDAEQAQVAESHSVSQFINFLIEHGAHVGQQMLRVCHSYIGLQDLRVQLYVPDALLVALKIGIVRAVRQLLPYWGFPGLYLLLFTSQDDTSVLYQLFPVLIEHGGVPQGTELYSKLKQCLALKSRRCRLYLEAFEQMHSSPLSLQELCRYQVRASLAAQASHAGHNLPALVRELSPPGLKEFLLMQPPADLGLLVCDNLLLVEASKQH